MPSKIVSQYVVKPCWKGDGFDDFRFIVSITRSTRSKLYGFMVESIEIKRIRPRFGRIWARTFGEDAMLRLIVEIEDPQRHSPEAAWDAALKVFHAKGCLDLEIVEFDR